ncbi:MAG: 5'/3'-nucleotidase SurE [Synergistaceae bacterium]|jgi:5'-nucleotidase|nr:5'/3'-nucleotidase SurE [Synergistaceae bacterium]
MKILLTNDDGVISQGIQSLSRMFNDKDWLAAVVAPDRERSGQGHSVTVDRPVRVHPLDPGMFAPGIPAYSCDGTPSDCVTIGLDVLCQTADFVVSGINNGPNMADDVTLSGTVSAAMEGVMIGRPAIAVSLCTKPGDSFKHNTTAALAATAVLEYVEKNPLPKDVMLNVNVPNDLIKNIKGFKITQRGNRKYLDRITCAKDPYGNDAYWIAGKASEKDEEGTDVTAVRDGYVSVTPLQLDMTQYDLLVEMRSQDIDKKLSRSMNLIK